MASKNTSLAVLFVPVTLSANLLILAPSAGAEPQRNVDGFMDNSFLVEEADHQEPGVVQRIFGPFYGQNRLGRPDEKSLSLGFTQEWPIFSQTQQFSHTMPYTFARSGGQSSDGDGEALLDHRFRAFAQTDRRLALESPLGQAPFSGAEVNALAGEPQAEIIVDRPDVSESSFTVPPGMWQAELGLRMNRQGSPHATGYFFDDLFRIGIKRDWELRLGGGGPAYRKEHGSKFAGLAPFYAGVKYHFFDRDPLPSMGLLLNANLPSPSRRFSSGQVDGNVLWVANKSWGPLELEPNVGPGAAWDADAREYYPQLVHATTLSYYPVKSFRIYAEAFGLIPGAKDGKPATSAGVGIHWYNFRKNIAVDLSATRGVSRLAREGNDWSLSVGFSFLR